MESALNAYLEKTEKTNKEIRKLYVALVITSLFMTISLFFMLDSVYAQTDETDPVTAINNTVLTISTFLGSVGLILGLSAGIIKKLGGQKVYTNKILGSVVSTLEKGGSSLEATDRGVKDNVDVLALVTNTLLRNPKIEEFVGREESLRLIKIVNDEVKEWDDDLHRYYDTIKPKLEDKETPDEVRLARVEAKFIPQD